jgi:hypothetical protein
MIQMKSEGTLEIVNVDYNTKYILTDALRKYSGLYKIVAVNQHGRDEAELDLVILGACYTLYQLVFVNYDIFTRECFRS